MASLDLRATFHIVNINTLIKSLEIVGLPGDVVNQKKTWLTHKSYLVSIIGKTFLVLDLSSGMIKGSILGPLLYAIYISP